MKIQMLFQIVILQIVFYESIFVFSIRVGGTSDEEREEDEDNAPDGTQYMDVGNMVPPRELRDYPERPFKDKPSAKGSNTYAGMFNNDMNGPNQPPNVLRTGTNVAPNIPMPYNSQNQAGFNDFAKPYNPQNKPWMSQNLPRMPTSIEKLGQPFMGMPNGYDPNKPSQFKTGFGYNNLRTGPKYPIMPNRNVGRGFVAQNYGRNNQGRQNMNIRPYPSRVISNAPRSHFMLANAGDQRNSAIMNIPKYNTNRLLDVKQNNLVSQMISVLKETEDNQNLTSEEHRKKLEYIEDLIAPPVEGYNTIVFLKNDSNHPILIKNGIIHGGSPITAEKVKEEYMNANIPKNEFMSSEIRSDTDKTTPENNLQQDNNDLGPKSNDEYDYEDDKLSLNLNNATDSPTDVRKYGDVTHTYFKNKQNLTWNQNMYNSNQHFGLKYSNNPKYQPNVYPNQQTYNQNQYNNGRNFYNPNVQNQGNYQNYKKNVYGKSQGIPNWKPGSNRYQSQLPLPQRPFPQTKFSGNPNIKISRQQNQNPQPIDPTNNENFNLSINLNQAPENQMNLENSELPKNPNPEEDTPSEYLAGAAPNQNPDPSHVQMPNNQQQSQDNQIPSQNQQSYNPGDQLPNQNQQESYPSDQPPQDQIPNLNQQQQNPETQFPNLNQQQYNQPPGQYQQQQNPEDQIPNLNELPPSPEYQPPSQYQQQNNYGDQPPGQYQQQQNPENQIPNQNQQQYNEGDQSPSQHQQQQNPENQIPNQSEQQYNQGDQPSGQYQQNPEDQIPNQNQQQYNQGDQPAGQYQQNPDDQIPYQNLQNQGDQPPGQYQQQPNTGDQIPNQNQQQYNPSDQPSSQNQQQPGPGDQNPDLSQPQQNPEGQIPNPSQQNQIPSESPSQIPKNQSLSKAENDKFQNVPSSEETNKQPVINQNQTLKPGNIPDQTVNKEALPPEVKDLNKDKETEQKTTTDKSPAGQKVKPDDKNYEFFENYVDIPGWDDIVIHTIKVTTDKEKDINIVTVPTIIPPDMEFEITTLPPDSEVVLAAKRTMLDNNMGYFLGFTHEMFQLIKDKTHEEAQDLIQATRVVLNKYNPNPWKDQDWAPSTMHLPKRTPLTDWVILRGCHDPQSMSMIETGALSDMGDAAKGLHNVADAVSMWPAATIQANLGYGQKRLINRESSFIPEVALILSIIDSAYNIQQGEALLKTLDTIDRYPMENKTAVEVAKETLDAILLAYWTAPVANRAKLFLMINDVIIKYNPGAQRRVNKGVGNRRGEIAGDANISTKRPDKLINAKDAIELTRIRLKAKNLERTKKTSKKENKTTKKATIKMYLKEEKKKNLKTATTVNKGYDRLKQEFYNYEKKLKDKAKTNEKDKMKAEQNKLDHTNLNDVKMKQIITKITQKLTTKSEYDQYIEDIYKMYGDETKEIYQNKEDISKEIYFADNFDADVKNRDIKDKEIKDFLEGTVTKDYDANLFANRKKFTANKRTTETLYNHITTKSEVDEIVKTKLKNIIKNSNFNLTRLRKTLDKAASFRRNLDEPKSSDDEMAIKRNIYKVFGYGTDYRRLAKNY